MRKRLLRGFVARGHIEACDAKDMATRATSSSYGGGFSVDAMVQVAVPVVVSCPVSDAAHTAAVCTGGGPGVSEAPRITPARGPPLWDDAGAQETGEGVEAEPDWDLANQSPPDYPDDQRTTW